MVLLQIQSVREAVVRSSCSAGSLHFFVICRLRASAHDLCPEAHDLVFRTSSGQPINADYLAKHFRSILDLAGLPRIRLYDLRHSAATIALAAGVSPKVVSEQLGHASTAFTLDTYAHVLPHMQDEAAARVEAMLFGATA